MLLHGSTIIETAEIKIAQEAHNKRVRAYRERYSQKYSRSLTLRDTFQRFLASSDPYITRLRKQTVKARSLPLPQAALLLIVEPDI